MRSSRHPLFALFAFSTLAGCASAQGDREATGGAGVARAENVGQVSQALTDATTWVQGGGSCQRANVNGYDTAIDRTNVSTLTEAWSSPDNYPTNAAIAFGHAYTGSADGVVRSVDTSTGVTDWTKTIPFPIYMSPAVAYGRVYFTAGKYLFAIASASSSLLFRIKHTSDVSFSSPMVLDDKVYVRDSSGKVFVYDAKALGTSVTPLYTFDVSAAADPTVGGGFVYVPSTDGKVYAFSDSGCAGSCTPAWSSADLGGTFWASAALWPPRLVVTVSNDAGASVHALDASSGVTLWASSLGTAPIATGPAVGYDKVHVALSEPAEVWALSLATGSLVWKAPLADTPTDTPSLASELLYVPSGRTTGQLEVFDTRCGTGGATCAAAKSLSVDPYGYSPSIAGGQVVFSAGTKTVAFATP